MSFRQSISGFQKKAKDKLSKIGHKLERGANVGDEEFARSALSLQSEPGIIVEGESRGDIIVGKGKDNPQSDDSRSVSRSVVRIGHSQGGSDNRANEEIDQKYLHPHLHVQTESGPSRESGDVDGKRTDQVIPLLRSDDPAFRLAGWGNRGYADRTISVPASDG